MKTNRVKSEYNYLNLIDYFIVSHDFSFKHETKIGIKIPYFEPSQAQNPQFLKFLTLSKKNEK